MSVIPPRGIGPVEEPNAKDVLFGRGGYTNAHPGNVRMRNLVAEEKDRYFDETATNIDKLLLVDQIRNRIRKEGGRFLKKEGDNWWDVGDEAARKKISQALRETMVASRKQQQPALSRPIPAPTVVPVPRSSIVSDAPPVATLTPLSQLFQQHDQEIISSIPDTEAPSSFHGSSGAPPETTPTPFSHQLVQQDQDITSQPVALPTRTTAGKNLPISHVSSIQNRHPSLNNMESMQGTILSQLARRQESSHLYPTASELGGGASHQLLDTIASQMTFPLSFSAAAASNIPLSASSQTPFSGLFYPNQIAHLQQHAPHLSRLSDQMPNLEEQVTGLLPPCDPFVAAAAFALHATGSSLQAFASNFHFPQWTGAFEPQHPASVQDNTRHEERRKVRQQQQQSSSGSPSLAQDDKMQSNAKHNISTSAMEDGNGIVLGTNQESKSSNEFSRKPAASSSEETKDEFQSKATCVQQASVAIDESSSTAEGGTVHHDAKANGTEHAAPPSAGYNDEIPTNICYAQQPSITVGEGTSTTAMGASHWAITRNRNISSSKENQDEIGPKASCAPHASLTKEGSSSTTTANANQVAPCMTAADNEIEAVFLLSSLREEDLDGAFYTPEQEKREQQEMTEEDRVEVLTDLFGDLCEIEPRRKKVARAEESFSQSDLVPYAIQLLVSEMRLEIERTPMENKAALVEAKAKCLEEEFSDERLELFLRCENMVPEGAAKRFVSYWTKRRKYFGPDKFHLPMTLAGALHGDEVALRVGVASMLARPDASGRPIVLYEQLRHMREGYTLDSLLRAVWYVFETVAQCPNVRKGVVVVVNAKNMTLWAFDRHLEMGIMDINHCMPFQYCGIHYTGAPIALAKILKPISLAFFAKRERARFVVHDTSGDDLMEVLASYGMSKDVLPAHMGGSRPHNHAEWLEQRAKEGK